jgi:hypothetical protein
MKTNLLFLLGLALLAMAFVAGRSSYEHSWDAVELGIAALFLAGGIGALRAGGRALDSTKPPAGGPGA